MRLGSIRDLVRGCSIDVMMFNNATYFHAEHDLLFDLIAQSGSNGANDLHTKIVGYVWVPPMI